MSDKGDRRSTRKARELRSNPTAAERPLWVHLSASKRSGIRFNRQFPIGPFVCDFVARSIKLVIEVDGGQHDGQSDEDATRTRYLQSQGFRVIRFWNNQVLEQIDAVVAEIERATADSPSPNPSRKREGNL